MGKKCENYGKIQRCRNHGKNVKMIKNQKNDGKIWK